jgi:tetratricopeptide (TPR) repeat protein
MTQTSRNFRIFVSSTFSDLKAERNALQERVFPRLRDLAASHGCRFQAIDLRWGVSEEAALDQQTMKICLGEIARCQKVSPRPNFIILIGGRYGWCPLPYEIPTNEFDLIIQQVSPDEKALVEEWYYRDDNALTPSRVLQPRTGGFVAYETWEPMELRLHSVLEAAARKANLGEASLAKYVASATEQEIIHGAFHAVDAREHIFCFARETDAIPHDQSAKDFIDFKQGIPDLHASEKLADLKIRLKNVLGGNYHQYNARWHDQGLSQDHLDGLCEDVYAALEQVTLKEVAALKQVDPLEQEVAAHQGFREQRAGHFVGRVAILKQIDDYLFLQNNQPLTVWGSSGSGKSALLARAVEEAGKKHPQENLVYRFIGATPDSSNGRALLKSLCIQITRLYGGEENTLPSAYPELVSEFPNRLALAGKDKPLIVFLDALDQLSEVDNARSLTWLPTFLPPHVKLVVSTLPGSCLQELERKLPKANCLELKPMPRTEGEALLDLWLEDVDRRLVPLQRTDILKKFELFGSPLYLKLAFEEASLWHSYDGLPNGADDIPGLGDDIPGILDDLLYRLSKESNHGRVMVECSLGYLAAAKNGLSEDELIDVLSLDNEVIVDFLHRSPKSPRVSRLPVVLFSRLYLDLKPYLTEVAADETTLLRFYHRQLGEIVAAKFLGGQERIKRHLALADYFEAKDVDVRKVEELPWHLAKAGEWKRLQDLLTDWLFFDFAWNMDNFAVERYWAQVEANSQFRMTEAYKPILEQHGDKLRHIGFVADLLGNTYHHEEAATLRAYLLEQHRGRTNPIELANTLNARGVSLKNTGDLEGAMKAYEEAEKIIRNLGERRMLATVLGNRGNILRRQEKYDQALSVLKEAEQISRDLNDQYRLGSSLNAISLVYFDLKEYEKALPCLKEQENLCRETGERFGLAAALCNQVSILSETWDAQPEELLALLREESAIHRELGIRPNLEESLKRQAKLVQRQVRSLSRGPLSQKNEQDKEKLIVLYNEEEKIWDELNNIEGVLIAQSNRAVVMAALGQREARSIIEQAYTRAVNDHLTEAIKQIKQAMDLVVTMIS